MTLEPDEDAGERLGLENRRTAGDDATDAFDAVGTAEERTVGVHQRQVAARLEPYRSMPRERDLETEGRMQEANADVNQAGENVRDSGDDVTDALRSASGATKFDDNDTTRFDDKDTLR